MNKNSFKLFLWFQKVKHKFARPKIVKCLRCGKVINTKKDKYSREVDLRDNHTDYWCKECSKYRNEQIENEIKKRDKEFKQFCKLHKPNALYCEVCENKKNCYL